MAININHSKNKIKTEDKLTIEAVNEVSVTNTRITELNDPIADQDAVNKRFLDQTLLASVQTNTFLYSNLTPMPEEVGGYESGNTFDNTTLQQLFTNLLYPYQYPNVQTFLMLAQPTVIEVGDMITGGNKTFSWTILNDENISANTVAIEDVTNNILYSNIYSNDGTEIINIGNDIIKTSAQKNTWKISAQNTKGQIISKTFSVDWRWRTYHGASVLESLNETEIKTLISSSLDLNFTGNKAVANEGYKYFIYPVAFGLKTIFQDISSGFAVAMNPAITVNITNEYGINNEYYVHRTTNPIVSSLTIAVK